MENETKLEKEPNLFGYIDYRLYLNDYQQWRVSEEKKFSRSHICREIGVPNTKSFFTEVVNGKRNLSNEFIGRFIRLLRFEGLKSKFFRTLVLFNQSENPSEKDYYLDQLINMNQTPCRIIDKDVYTYFSEWQHSAIRALLDTFSFTSDYRDLGKRLIPSISEKKAKASITLLKRLKFISKNKQGVYKPCDLAISTEKSAKSELVRHYQAQMMDMAKNAMVSQSGAPQNNKTNTMSMSQKAFEKIDSRLEKFASEVRAILQKDSNPADRVYHLNLNLFPLAKINNTR